MSRTVKLGTDTVEIHAFSPGKFLECSEALADLIDSAPTVMEDLDANRRAQEERSAVLVTRAEVEAQWPSYAGRVTDEAWAAAPDGRVKLVPGRADYREALLAVVPKVYKQARRPAEHLMVTAALPNDAYEDADDEGVDDIRTTDAYKKMRKRVLHRATLGEAAVMLATAIDVVREEAAAQKDPLMEVVGALAGTSERSTDDDDESPAQGTASQPDERTSSAPSRARSRGGRRGSSSTASAGATSSPSPTN